MTEAPSAHPMAPHLGAQLRSLAGDIKLAHSVFALPWALLATVLAAHGQPIRAVAEKLLLIIICMVTARTAAMSANRLLDARIDAGNPRTARRAIPGGRLSPAVTVGVIVLVSLIFIAAAAMFEDLFADPWPLVLSLPVLAFLTAYPLLKRFSALCHFYLGAALGIAPICASLAVCGKVLPTAALLGAAVTLWTAAFDIIYACQDFEFDVKSGLWSVPAKVGISRALWISRIAHVICLGLLIAAGLCSPLLGIGYFIGVAIAAGLLIVEHTIVSPTDLSKVNVAFFTINGIISLLVGLLGMADVIRLGR
jgi:4-hydroxybenzoate polyprenyltransferase